MLQFILLLFLLLFGSTIVCIWYFKSPNYDIKMWSLFEKLAKQNIFAIVPKTHSTWQLNKEHNFIRGIVNYNYYPNKIIYLWFIFNLSYYKIEQKKFNVILLNDQGSRKLQQQLVKELQLKYILKLAKEYRLDQSFVEQKTKEYNGEDEQK